MARSALGRALLGGAVPTPDRRLEDRRSVHAICAAAGRSATAHLGRSVSVASGARSSSLVPRTAIVPTDEVAWRALTVRLGRPLDGGCHRAAATRRSDD